MIQELTGRYMRTDLFFLFLLLGRRSVNPNNYSVVSLVRLQCHLFLWLHLLRLHLLHFAGKHGLGLRGRVNTVRLDGDDEMAAILEEILRVERHDSGLVGLGYVGKDAVHHGDQHPVLVRVPGVLDDGHNVRALFRDIQQIPEKANIVYFEKSC